MTTAVSDQAALAPGILESGRLQQALSGVLEAMFFCPADEVLVNPRPDEWETPRREHSHSSCLQFTGPVNGAFGIACSAALARSLAESFHGETPSSEEVSAVLLELSNIVCGNHLSQLEARGVFHLESPRPFRANEWTGLNDEARAAAASSTRTRLALRTEEGWIGAWIEIAA
jgi:CheY-specific phosphatase CheX